VPAFSDKKKFGIFYPDLQFEKTNYGRGFLKKNS
jgi:hypothetical protein